NVLPASDQMETQSMPTVSLDSSATTPVPSELRMVGSKYDEPASTLVGGSEETRPIVDRFSTPMLNSTPPAHLLQHNIALTDPARREAGQLRKKAWPKLLYSVLVV